MVRLYQALYQAALSSSQYMNNYSVCQILNQSVKLRYIDGNTYTGTDTGRVHERQPDRKATACFVPVDSSNAGPSGRAV